MIANRDVPAVVVLFGAGKVAGTALRKPVNYILTEETRSEAAAY